jgi:hypothetical protein
MKEGKKEKAKGKRQKAICMNNFRIWEEVQDFKAETLNRFDPFFKQHFIHSFQNNILFYFH